MNWFAGSTFNIWKEFLFSNPRILTPNNWLKILITTLVTLGNSKKVKKEYRLFSKSDIDNVKIMDPIFILGHWRSGTTHLHNILIQDEQFNFPTLLQVTFPNTFLSIKERLDKKRRMKSNKRPMDNVEIDINSPGEEEVAVWTLCSISSIGNRLLKSKESYYDKFLTFENANKDDFELWKSALFNFLRKVSLKNNKRLILKSPESTARINILLELFPNAKFINIHRNPIDVFKSTKHLYHKVFKPSYYHRVEDQHLTERIIFVYKNMYTAFFKHKDLIPEQNFVDIGYEELTEDPIKTVRRIYDELNITFSREYEERITAYLNEIKSYTKNEYEKESMELENRIVKEWSMCFRYWNYPFPGEKISA